MACSQYFTFVDTRKNGGSILTYVVVVVVVVGLTILPRRVTIGVRRQRLTQCGPVAQLGARMNGIHEVTGSIPVWSTNLLPLQYSENIR